ncbi:unnamed protein product [Didymodactylos carnosus]|uniref:RFX-type winged-helix domain-containing protein n=1 Tax=Didymodactylos carnosus TaxID=1234261 RepID=A0A8S2F4F9_9BILA|nr:unnamed protein product [Didymodactylos carnosus]CAF4186972.1 unnamed protein product [Didymodactylos carnosus]
MYATFIAESLKLLSPNNIRLVSPQSTKSTQPRQGSISHQTPTGAGGASQYVIATSTSGGTSGDQSQSSGQTGRVIIATAQATNSNSAQASTSNTYTNGSGFQNGAPVQFQFNTSDGTLYTGTNSFFHPQQNQLVNDSTPLIKQQCFVYHDLPADELDSDNYENLDLNLPQQQLPIGPQIFRLQSRSSGDGYSHHILSCENGTGTFTFLQDENSAQTLAHTTRASPATVQWLVDNFEPAEGCSLRRSILYSFYLQHCQEQKLEQVNPASFGKLIRSVFLGLRTRRLGTRGNSKYHYYGIRLKGSSTLNQYTDKNGELMFKEQHHFGATNTKKRGVFSQSTANANSSASSSPTHLNLI